MPRTLIREDAMTRLYEVTDENGNVIGTDEESVGLLPPETPSPDIVIASVAAMTDEQKAALREALGL